MPTYITLFRYTQKGIEDIKNGPKRLDEAKQRARAAGGEIKAFYLVRHEKLGARDAIGAESRIGRMVRSHLRLNVSHSPQ
jgi:uncharacterized protein with GYD domain